jgi:hypothetical protein
MSWNQNQGQTGGEQDPYSGYGTPQNPYETPSPQDPNQYPQNPYGAPPPPENPYGAPPPPENPYGGTNYGGNYQQGQQGYGYAPPQATPLPLGQAIQQLPGEYIRVLTHPSPQTFAAEIGKADWGIVWAQLIAYAVIGAILAFLSSLISPTRLTGTTTSGISPTTFTALAGGVSFAYIIIIPIFFFIWMGILYGLSKAFGGQGTFLQQSYATLLFQVPLGILASLVGLIPIAGAIIALAIDIYVIVLQIFAVMAVHRLSGGKATAAVLIPVAVVLLLLCALVVVIVAVAANAIRNGGY